MFPGFSPWEVPRVPQCPPRLLVQEVWGGSMIDFSAQVRTR